MDRVEEALRGAYARRQKLTIEELKTQRLILLRARHLLVCTPISLDDPKTQHHTWHRDLAPAIGGEGCDCFTKSMVVLGPEYFLARRESAA